MTYHGQVGIYRKPLGIKPTKEDHVYAHALSVMGLGVRVLCERLGERFKLGKPMSRMLLYYYFRKDLVPSKRGRKRGNTEESKKRLTKKMEQNIKAEMERLIREVGERGEKF